jgi:chromosome partitioning protein
MRGVLIMQTKIIALVNQKGGVGKSNASFNIAVGLAKQGKKVLVVDLDPQGSLTESMGFQNPDMLEITVSTILAKVISSIPIEKNEGILHHDEGVDLLPANIELSGIDVSLVNTMSRELILKEYIDQIKSQYQYIIIDNMPSLGMLTINALAAADSVIIPTQTHYLSIKGMEQLLKTITKVKKQINPNLKVEGVLLTMVDKRTNFAKDISKLIRDTYDDRLRIFKNEIPLSIRAAEATVVGKSIYAYDPKGKVAQAYEGVVKEVQNIEKSRIKHKTDPVR